MTSENNTIDASLTTTSCDHIVDTTSSKAELKLLIADEFSRIRSELPVILERAESALRDDHAPFLYCNKSIDSVVWLHCRDWGDGKWFFVGDLHGDFVALIRLLEAIRSRCPSFRLCFLGDLIDRGPYSLECFAALWVAAEKSPGQIIWIKGNHDQDLHWSESEQQFMMNTEPCEFKKLLNDFEQENVSGQQMRRWGCLFCELIDRLPHAVLFPDGLLASHGGFPLRDLWDKMTTYDGLLNPKAVWDFTWTRMGNRPKTRPNPYYPDDREYGWTDFEDFCAKVGPFFPVRRMVRGHDHVENGTRIADNCKPHPVLTLNAFGFHHYKRELPYYKDTLPFGVYIRDELPRVEFIPSCSEDRVLYPWIGLIKAPEKTSGSTARVCQEEPQRIVDLCVPVVPQDPSSPCHSIDHVSAEQDILQSAKNNEINTDSQKTVVTISTAKSDQTASYHGTELCQPLQKGSFASQVMKFLRNGWK